MNNYIFNMEENARRILQEGTYLTKGLEKYEHVGFIKYLIELGQTRENIFEIWSNTELEIKKRGWEEEDIKNFFDNVYTQAQSFIIHKGKDIWITQREIDFINEMRTTMWVKQYILALLSVYKYYGHEWLDYKDIKTFCYSVTSVGREVNEAKTKVLHNCRQNYNAFTIKDRLILSPTGEYSSIIQVQVNFIDSSLIGEKTLLRDPREISKLFYKLKCEEVCKKCGKVFNNFSNKIIKTNLCKYCRDKEQEKAKNKKKYQKRKKFTPLCEQTTFSI